MFTVVYGTGDYDATTWHRCEPVATLRDAHDLRDRLVRRGIPAYSALTSWWQNVGMPEGEAPGWNHVNLCWSEQAIKGETNV